MLEVNPITREIVWQYAAANSGDPVWTFFTWFVGNVQRLPNGATLINEGMNGRIFQVTPSGEIVWEYINPYIGSVVNPYPNHVAVPGGRCRTRRSIAPKPCRSSGSPTASCAAKTRS